MNRDGIGGAARTMTGGQECECYISGYWERHRYEDGHFQWRTPSGDWHATKLHPGEWRLGEPEPVRRTAQPDLPTPVEGCELWEVYQTGITLYVKRPHEVGIPGDPLLGDLANDARWTGRAWWRNETGWRLFGDARLRWNGDAPAYIEMKMETP